MLFVQGGSEKLILKRETFSYFILGRPPRVSLPTEFVGRKKPNQERCESSSSQSTKATFFRLSFCAFSFLYFSDPLTATTKLETLSDFADLEQDFWDFSIFFASITAVNYDYRIIDGTVSDIHFKIDSQSEHNTTLSTSISKRLSDRYEVQKRVESLFALRCLMKH